jgi:hypothetical protein
MEKLIDIKNRAKVVLDYFIRINFGGETAIPVWNYQKSFVESLDINSMFKKRQLSCIYNDSIECIRDFTGEQLMDLLLFSLNQGVELNLGKSRDWRIINYYLKEKKVINTNEIVVLKSLFNNYKDDVKFSDDKKKALIALLNA